MTTDTEHPKADAVRERIATLLDGRLSSYAIGRILDAQIVGYKPGLMLRATDRYHAEVIDPWMTLLAGLTGADLTLLAGGESTTYTLAEYERRAKLTAEAEARREAARAEHGPTPERLRELREAGGIGEALAELLGGDDD